MEDRKRLEELATELNMYQAQADAINQQMETVRATLTDLSIAEDTLEAIKDKKKDETLVPIGAGSFIITEIKNVDEVIVGLGSGVAVRKKIPDAKKSIEEQKKDLEALMAKMSEDLKRITEIIVRKTPEAEELIQKMEGTGNSL
jgi:prefoldin alpha subunit